MNKKMLLILLIFVFSCQVNEVNKENSNKKEINKLNSKINDFYLSNTESGKLKWKVEAKEAEISQDNSSIKVSKGKINFYEKNKFVSQLLFESAVIDLKTNNIALDGKNIIYTVEKEKIITYNIKYISESNFAYSDADIYIEKEGNIIKGKGFETFDGFKTIKIRESFIAVN